MMLYSIGEMRRGGGGKVARHVGKSPVVHVPSPYLSCRTATTALQPYTNNVLLS